MAENRSALGELVSHLVNESKDVAKETAKEMNIHGAVTAIVLILKRFASEEIMLISFLGCSFVVTTHLHFREKRKKMRVKQNPVVYVSKNF